MAITSDKVPTPPSPATLRVDPNDPYPGITARPLQMPDFINIKPKNSALSLRFVNRVAGNGQRYDQMKYAGFVPVTPDEVYMPGANGQQMPIDKSLIEDGKVIFGDLIVMKIAKNLYEGALKYNWQRSINRLHPKAQLQTGKAKLREAIQEVGGQASRIPDLNKKLSAFRPSDSEIAKAEQEDDGSAELPT